MGKLTGNSKYYDDACRQILQFSERMFNNDKNLYMHGWIQDMNPHPEYYWARCTVMFYKPSNNWKSYR